MDHQTAKTNDRPFKRSRNEVRTLQIAAKPEEPWFPKILVIHSDNQEKPLSKISPFLVAKTLEQAIGKAYNAKKLGSGDIQVEIQSRQQSSALMSLGKIGETLVSVTAHRTSNMVKGVISVDELLSCTESEIEEGIKEQGVVSAKSIVLRRDNKEIPTKHIILTLQLHALPPEIKAGYVNCRIRPYIPNPKRCFKCQRFGHHSQVCRGQLVCPKCASTNHSQESCGNAFHCVNCQGDHPAYSRTCPRFKDEKEVLKIKTEQNLTFKAARAQLDFQRNGTFSEVVRRGVAPPRKSVETQTVGPPLQTPHHVPTDTQVSPSVSLTSQSAEQEDAAGTSKEAGSTLSLWDGFAESPSQSIAQDMELDGDDCMSQKSSSSLPGMTSQVREQREKTGGRGRGNKPRDKSKLAPPRVLPP
ncbi:uncharacterized protein LOC135371633 [Ornithodoros turicata]|uniref:uncharacterized protein LOC135371633 n=1 Tax=Ornithodoros turicata TaxID=34597 RepID=UPI0031391872